MSQSSKIKSIKTFPVTHSDLHGNPLNYLFVRVETDSGHVGYGEACDTYGCTYPLVTAAAVEHALAPTLIGQPLESIDNLVHRMRGWTRRRLGDQGTIIHAISAVEIALWDALGKEQGKSVSEMLGAIRDHIPVYASGTFLVEGPTDWHMKLLEPCLEGGVSALKVRFSTDYKGDTKRLEDFTKALRAAYGPIDVFIDGSENFNLETARRLCRTFDSLGVSMFEEPIPQSYRLGIQRLVEKSPISIAYGENLYTNVEFTEALQNGLCDVIQPDPSISGGISEMVRASRAAEAYGIPVIPHSAAGPFALAATLHLAAALPNLKLFEYSFTLDRLWRELVSSPVLGPSVLKDGTLPVPSGPGLGLEVDESVFEKYPFRPTADYSEMPTRSLGNI